MIFLQLLHFDFTQTDREDDSLTDDEKNSSRFNFCSMCKTKKVVILPLVSKTAEKKHTQFHSQLSVTFP